MSANADRPEKADATDGSPGGYEPTHEFLGVDGAGLVHHYDGHTDRFVRIDPTTGERERVEPRDGKTLTTWHDFVAETGPGWKVWTVTYDALEARGLLAEVFGR